MNPLFADPTVALDNIQMIAINLLAIVGGFIIGGQFTRVVCRFIFQWTVKRQPPKPVMILIQHSGGAVIAIAIALLVFGSGLGIGFGNGTGDGPGNATNPDDPTKKSNNATLIEPKIDPKILPPIEPKKIEEPSPNDLRERVIVLSGSDSLARYYRIEGRKDRMSFPEITRHLRERKLEPKPIVGVSILVYRNSPSLEHKLVTQLAEWVKNEKLSVDFPPVQTEAMPE